MKTAAERTVPLFPGLEALSPPRPGPSLRTLSRRLKEAAHRWYLNEVGYEEVLLAARAYDEALERA